MKLAYTVLQASLLNAHMYLPAMRKTYAGRPGSIKYAPSRSCYTPAGPQRNCGYAGISPKHMNYPTLDAQLKVVSKPAVTVGMASKTTSLRRI